MIEIVRHPEKASCYRLTCEVWLPASPERVFEFFSDATQLERLTPPWLKFSVLTPTPLEMHEGTLIDYKLRVHGIPLRWQSKITCWDPPHQFADAQVRGPYRLWLHSHTFISERGGTRCRDEVEYSPIGGVLVHAAFVKKDLRSIFEYRTKTLHEIFADEADESVISSGTS